MVSLKTLNNGAKIATLLLAVAGLWTALEIGKRTGFFAMLKGELQADIKLLPGAQKPLKTTFTGLPFIDRTLSRLTMVLWPAIDGTWPRVSLIAFEFSGQFAGAWMVAGLEGLRAGNRGGFGLLTFTTIIGTIAQLSNFALILSLYLFLHHLTSPTSLDPNRQSHNDSVADLLVDPFEVAAWPIAFTLSYLVLTLLVALPSPTYTSFQTHQVLIAIWILYPIPLKIFQSLLSRWFSGTLSPDKGYKSSTQRNARALSGLRYVYLLSIAVGAITHIVTLTISLSSIFFPALFNPDLRAGLSPIAVFLPVSPFSTKPVENPGDGLSNLLTWDMAITGTVSLIWGAVQYRNAHEGRMKWEGWSIPLLKLSALTLVGGPASAFAAFMWARDEMVLGEAGDSERKKYI